MRFCTVMGALAFLVLGGVTGCIFPSDPDALWRLVSQRCAHDVEHKPCALYQPDQGYALLKDIHGKGQYLVIPTQRLPGVESTILLQANTPNYFAIAWDKRDWVKRAYGVAIPDRFLSLVVNSRSARSQNQLHIHMDCLRPDVVTALQAQPVTAEQGEIVLLGRRYRTTRFSSLESSPFLNFALEDEKGRAAHGLAIVFLGEGDFLLLEDRAHGLDFGDTEILQDHHCHVAGL